MCPANPSPPGPCRDLAWTSFSIFLMSTLGPVVWQWLHLVEHCCRRIHYEEGGWGLEMGKANKENNVFKTRRPLD